MWTKYEWEMESNYQRIHKPYEHNLHVLIQNIICV